MTPAALSYQIKNLEEHLEVRLFRRLNRTIELTEAGEALRPGVEEGFAAFQEAVASLARLTGDATLTVTAGPAFTAKWLAPRMFRFAEAHPRIELRFVASLKVLDFDRDQVDVAIRFGTGNHPGCFEEVLIEDWVKPHCAPEIAREIDRPADFLRFQLIHDDSLRLATDRGTQEGIPTWAAWFLKMGVEADTGHGIRFSNADHAIDAASEGAGIVLGRCSLLERDVQRGRLAAPFPEALDTGRQFRFVCPAGRETEPRIAAFLDWLRIETGSLREKRRAANLLS